MEEAYLTQKQAIMFTAVLSFIVAVAGTALALQVVGPRFGLGLGDRTPSIFGTANADQPANAVAQEDMVVSVVQKVSPAVVSVVASKDVRLIERSYGGDPFENDPFFQQFFGGQGTQIPQTQQNGAQKQEVSSGSGFIVSSDGLIVTNKHVVADTQAEYAVFLNDGTKKTARVLARDPLNDVAVIKIDASNLPTVMLGDSATVKTGQTAIAIGNPLEFRNTVSVGVISGLHRSIVASDPGANPESLQELIQTDAAINPGNSGGPLLNLRGEVIAMNTAMAQGAENIGFAIPVNTLKRAVDSSKANGKIVYPFLGVNYQLVTSDLVDQKKLGRDYGVLIVSGKGSPAVVPESPAARAGLKEGDIILSLNGEKITPESLLISLIQKYDVGAWVTLRVYRVGKEFDVKTKLDERKS